MQEASDKEKNIASSRARLSEAKLALLEKKLKGHAASGKPSAMAAQAARSTTAPLSGIESEIWFFQQLNPQSNAFNITISMRVKGRLEVTTFTRALNSVLKSRNFTGSRFAASEGKAVRMIGDGPAISLPVADITGLTKSAQLAEIEKMKAEDFRQPFDLARGPIIRAKLIATADDEHLLLISSHGLMADCESAIALAREAFFRYEAHLEKSELSHGAAAGRISASASEAIAHVTPLSDTCVRRSFPATGSGLSNLSLAIRRGPSNFTALVLNERLTKSLRMLASSQQAPVCVVLASALAAELCGDSGGERTIELARREYLQEAAIEVESASAVRVRLEGRKEFRSLVREVSKAAIETQGRRLFQMEALIKSDNPASSANPNHFEMLFRFQQPLKSIAAAGLTIEIEPVIEGNHLHDFALNISEKEDALIAIFSYGVGLAGECEARRLIETFEQRLQDRIESPDAFIVSFSAEQNQPLRSIDNGQNPAFEQRNEQTIYSASRSPLEQKIAKCLEESFQLPKVGIHDNFLRFSGDYNQLINFHHRLITDFGISLPLLTLIENPTVSRLSLAIVNHQIEQSNPLLAGRFLDQIEQLSEEETRWIVASESEFFASKHL